MKNYLTLSVTTALLLFGLPTIKAQSNCAEVQKENEYLKKALQITTPTKSATSAKIDFNLIKCEGNIKEQTVELILTLVNHDAHKDFQFASAKAIDVEANEYTTYDMNIGSAQSRNKLYTETPVKAVIKFKKVLPSVKLLKLIPIEYYDSEQPGRHAGFEYKDIPVSWK